MHADGTLVVHQMRPGTGLPLVLLHGFPLDTRMWRDVVDLIPGQTPVYGVDLPGLGESPTGDDVAQTLGLPAEPSLDVSADGVAAALALAGVERAVVAGLSMGGYVVLALLERHPDLVAGAGLVDTKAGADPEEARANRLRVAEQVLREEKVDAVLGMRTSTLGRTNRVTRPDLADRIERWIRDQGPAGIAWSQRAMAARPDRTEVLGAYAGPVAVVVGDEDELSPLEVARQMSETAQDSRLTVVPRAGHMTAIEAPEPVASALARLVAVSDTA
ncbi:MAG: alpha/beta fold hydrolase [Cellulomonadaceae bacterium]